MKLTSTKVKDNTTVSVTKGGVKKDVKRGNSIDLMDKVKPSVTTGCKCSEPSKDVVGLSKGVTLNMGDYQSLRADAWATTEVREDETVQQAYERIEALIDEQLDISINSVPEL